MKALLLAATSSLALTGFAMAQTAAPAPAPATTTTTTVADPVAAAGDKAEDAEGRGSKASSGPGWRGCCYASSRTLTNGETLSGPRAVAVTARGELGGEAPNDQAGRLARIERDLHPRQGRAA